VAPRVFYGRCSPGGTHADQRPFDPSPRCLALGSDRRAVAPRDHRSLQHRPRVEGRPRASHERHERLPRARPHHRSHARPLLQQLRRLRRHARDRQGRLHPRRAYGKGQLFDRKGRFIGYCDVSQGSVGAQIGGQTFGEIVFFETDDALTRFKSDRFTLTAQASAAALAAGADAATSYADGVASSS